MTSGKLHKKPDDLARERLVKRTRKILIQSGARIGKLSDSDKKTPSQKHSESGRKRLLKRDGRSEESARAAAFKSLVFDCYTCSKKPCDTIPQACNERMILERCGQCGMPIRHWIDPSVKWERCGSCRGDK